MTPVFNSTMRIQTYYFQTLARLHSKHRNGVTTDAVANLDPMDSLESRNSMTYSGVMQALFHFPKSIRRGWIPLVLLALFLGPLSCASEDDGEGGNPFGDAVVYLPGGGAPGTPGYVPENSAGDDKPQGSESGDEGYQFPTYGVDGLEIIFLHDVTKPLTVEAGSDIEILTKVIDYSTGGPAGGIALSWSIIDAIGFGAPGDAELGQSYTYTDDEGQSSADFFANLTPDVLYVVEVVTDGGTAKTIEVEVVNVPLGDLKVAMEYEGPIQLNSIRVQLLPGDFKCSTFNPVAPPQVNLGEKTVLNTESKPTFTDLNANQKVTVVAVAKGPNGTLAGAGCEAAIFIEADSNNEIVLELYVLTLNPAGVYDAENAFNLMGSIPGQLGDVLDTLTTLFYDPGAFLVDQIKNLVKQAIGGLLTDLIFGLFEDQLADIITDWVLNDSPDWLQDFFTIGQDIFQVVANLQLTGDLKISKLVSDYYIQGQTTFTGITFTWKLNCDKNAPDYDECGLYPFSLEDIDDENFPLDLLEGQWTGTIVSYDELKIDPHNIGLNYGKLILFVFNNLILQELTGQNTLVGAAVEIIGCDGIADGLSSLGIDEDDIYDACVGAVTLLMLPLESYLLGLETDSLVKLSGTAEMRDEDSDLIVDTIIDGVWDGQIIYNGASTSPFSGTWEAIRYEGQ